MTEVSGNRSVFAVVLLSFITVISIIMTTRIIVELELNPVNETLLLCTVLTSIALLVVYVRVYFIQDAYYRERFSTENLGNGQTKVKYLQSTGVNPFLLIAVLFKPMKAVKIGEFTVDVGEVNTIGGTLTASNGRFSIGKYHLKETYKLYEYLGEEIELTVRGNRQEIIEKNLVEYKIQDVKKKSKLI